MVLISALALLMSVRVVTTAPAGHPVLFEGELPEGNPRRPLLVTPEGSKQTVPAKVEWRYPSARVSWISTGAAAYVLSTGEGDSVEPAMAGTGDRMTYGRAGVRARLTVGLYSAPAVLDYDGDGNLDLVVGSPDRPYNGIFYFRNRGTNAAPLFERGEWWGPDGKDLVAADFNGDGKTDLVTGGGYYSDVRANRLSRFVAVKLPRSYHIGRDDLWYPVDWDRDGRIDVLAGVSDWREYGWDDAWDSSGRWTRGPVHGYIYFHRNTGSNESPVYAEPVPVFAGGRAIDLRGSPCPNPVDWFGTGRLDLVGGDFIDTITLFRNSGRGLEGGRLLTLGGETLRFELCMIQPRVVSWHADGRPSLVVGEEGGAVTLVENLARRGQEPRFAAPRQLEQIDPYLKSGSLVRPVAFDWNADGRLDIVAGNSAGYLEYFENTGTREAPAFIGRGYLKAAGRTIRVTAGPNGSVQGPIEEKWGYANPSIADWDLDGRPDILVNDIWGKVVWYKNAGAELQAARDIEVEWEGAPPKPDWVWWTPKGKQLVTQWRTTPKAVDWTGDGLPDLVMLDYRGYLALYRRARRGGELVLLPPERIFEEPNGRFLYLSRGRGGASGRRKIELADWDGDGDLDLITDTADGAGWYENRGTREKPVMAWRGELTRRKISGHNPTPNAADWNGDGRPDLIIGGEDGHLYYFDRRFLDAGGTANSNRM